MDKDRILHDAINVYGAREHNLKNIDVTFPRNALSVVTGMSGCGKSSLAFDTIFAEGQRRYIETFSAYARNMLGSLERPDVDEITGLSPVISIEQKTVNKNPRSTIGTATEIYDFFRLLFARMGEARSYISGKPMVKYSRDKIVDMIVETYSDKAVYLLSPLVSNRKGHYRELFESLRKKGYLHVRVDGVIYDLGEITKLDRYKKHDIELVIDKLKINREDIHRIRKSVEEALKQGGKQMMVIEKGSDSPRHFSMTLMDPETGLSYPDPAPHNFSFNSPQGACPRCRGFGTVKLIDESLLIPDKEKSISEGGLAPLGKNTDTTIMKVIKGVCEKYGVTLKTPLKDFPPEAINDIIYGSNDSFNVGPLWSVLRGVDRNVQNEGLIGYLEDMEDTDDGGKIVDKFMSVRTCPECNGMRLEKTWLHFFIDGKNISEVAEMDIETLYQWSQGLEDRLDRERRIVAEEIMKEIRTRLKFLLDVGLDYVSLNRESSTLSGGESQRIRLATQLGSQLVNVLYILDEPSIGLHQRDNMRLIDSLRKLRDNGNSVIVVEHDKDMMKNSDYLVDIGPGAGVKGGEVVYQGTPEGIDTEVSITGRYLSGKDNIALPAKRRKGNGCYLEIKGASGNNLKDVNIKIPLGKFICVTGVSGSGKSSLINGTLHPILSQKFYRSLQAPLPYKEITGIENIDKVVVVDQSPLGRTPRSNPATYTGLFSDIRKLFVNLPESKIRGYKPGRFSFNVAGGRCEMCRGNGYRTIEMNFLPDVLVPCESCHGKRYNRETLEVRYKGKSISDVLEMTVSEAVVFFENIPVIYKRLKVLEDIGLGYVKLGQPSSTLSGGENQRVKLATELSKKDTGKTLYILDEPTTGLHFEDIKILLNVIGKLVDKGNTMIVIEHNLDVIKSADYVIDIGPDGGRKGGRIVAQGTPEQVAKTDTFTAHFLKEELSGTPKTPSHKKC